MNASLLARIVSSSLVTSVVAVTWDTWWHGAVGRDTFWEPPHILLYAATGAAFLGGLYGWYKFREKIWKRLAVVLLMVPLLAPFDELWHRFFGVEELTSPLVVWSPPHVLAIGAIIISLFFALSLITREKDITARRIFGGLIFAAILNLFLVLTIPLQPIGPYAVIGFWGAGVAALVFSGVILSAQKWIPGFASATMMIAFFVFFVAFSLEGSGAADIVIQPHDHSPGWLILFSVVIPAIAIDLLRKWPLWFRGALVGLFWSGILFGFSSGFFEPQFQYSNSEAAIAILASLIGGIIAGLLVLYLKERKLV